MSVINGLFDFLDSSPSPFHACASAAELLEGAGYLRLEETDCWRLTPGGKYYVTRGGTACIAFRMPVYPEGFCGWRLTASHSDSPSWRIKKTDSGTACYTRPETEGYGGMIMPSWMDRPLSVAGRVILRNEDGVEAMLVAPERNLLVIPNVCIHFSKDLNRGYAYNPQVDLQPVCGPAGGDLLDALDVNKADVVDYDLNLCVRQKAERVGLNGEWFISPRIDDLECAYETLRGFVDAQLPEELSAEDNQYADLWAMLDNEEVGSSSYSGAQGTFVSDVMARIEESIGLSAEASRACRANSLLISADNGHAVHPNHPEKSDPEHPVVMGGGVVLKYDSSHKYTTSGMTGALFREICRRRNIPVQTFFNRADVPGGSTLGNLLGHSIGVPMLDIGLAQLAMHSAVETASCADADYAAEAVTAFYETPYFRRGDMDWDLG